MPRGPAGRGLWAENGPAGAWNLALKARGGIPRCGFLNLQQSMRFDRNDQGQGQPNRWTRMKSSLAETPSSRSASSSASRSSASSADERRTTSSSSRVKTVTTVPSRRVSPSTTTLPSMTVPVAAWDAGTPRWQGWPEIWFIYSFVGLARNAFTNRHSIERESPIRRAVLRTSSRFHLCQDLSLACMAR